MVAAIATIVNNVLPVAHVPVWILAQSDTLPGAAEIGQAVQNEALLNIKTFDSLWQELASGNSPIYQAVVKFSLPIATVLIAVWAVPFFNTILSDGLSGKTFGELFWPLVIILMLGINKGLVGANTCLFFRNITNSINNGILQQTINGIQLEQAIKQSNFNQASGQMFAAKVEECKKLPVKDSNGVDSQGKCLKTAIAEMNRLAQEYHSSKKWEFKIDLDINKILTKVANQPIINLLLILLSAFQGVFVLIIEITAILNAYIAPVFLALSLLPGQSKLIYAWLSGWLAIALVKISYTIIVGVATCAIVKTEESNVLLLPLIIGVFSPILAIALGSGGGMALFNSLTSFGASGTRLLIRGGQNLGGGGGRNSRLEGARRK